MDTQDKNENVVRTILKNEITWMVMIGSAIFAFVYQVVIPINSIQTELIEINNQIVNLQGYDARITKNSNDIIVLQEQMKTIFNQPQ